MFKRISRTLALQFTLFVFVLFLVNGCIFLFADFTNARRQAEFRLQGQSRMVMNAMMTGHPVGSMLPTPLQNRVRIVDATGNTLYGADMYDNMPVPRPGLSDINYDDEHYNVFTFPIIIAGAPAGFGEIADVDRQQVQDLPFRAFIYLLVSLVVTALTYFVGLFFAKRSLEPAEEMFERLQQFTQDASHELRTPLAILGSSLDLALKTGNHKEGLLSAKEDLHEIAVLIERLLELAQLDSFTVTSKPVALSVLVTQAAEKFSMIAKKKSVTIKTDIAENVRVMADEALLRQVLSNLLSNAIKFNKKKGIVTVKLTKNILEVSDTGIGIDPKDLPHVFDRFYQADTSRSKDGFGLGLALVKRIVDLHRWTVSVKSQKGVGTTFGIHMTA